MELVQITAVIGAAASLICTLVVGALSFFIKRTLSSLESNDQKNAEPLIYVTREDFIRIMNRVEDKLDLLLYNSPQEKRKEE